MMQPSRLSKNLMMACCMACTFSRAVFGSSTNSIIEIRQIQKAQPIAGDVIVKFVSAAPSTQTGGCTAQFRVIKPLDTDLRKSHWHEGDIINLHVVPNESRLPLLWQVNSEYEGRVLLVQVKEVNGNTTFKRQWTIPSENAQVAVEREQEGTKDVNKILAVVADTDKIAAFLAVTRATTSPSIVLAAEAFDLARPNTPDAQRLKLVEGLMTLFDRVDTPIYVKEASFNIADRVHLVNDLQETSRNVTITKSLLSSFHKSVSGSKSGLQESELQGFILEALLYNLSAVKSDRRLDVAMTTFSQDMQQYKKSYPIEYSERASEINQLIKMIERPVPSSRNN